MDDPRQFLEAAAADEETGVRALQTIEIAVRHAESFAAMQDAIAQPSCHDLST